MANFINRTKYYAASIGKYPFQRYFACPACGCQQSTVVDRKYLVTTLARCGGCEILFRQPITTQEEADDFYRDGYTTENTDAPFAIANGEPWTVESVRAYRDASEYVRVLEGLGLAPGASVLDYGCSWGYVSVQVRAAGFRVTAYEISPVNRRIAHERLGLPVIDDFDAFAADPGNHDTFDVFFSSHVLEHVPSVTGFIAKAMKLVKPGGVFVAFVPNGSEEFMDANRWRWRRLWGEVHPLFLDARFFKRLFPSEPMLLGATPVPDSALATFKSDGGRVVAGLAGKELTCVVRKNAERQAHDRIAANTSASS